jgi:hypothetical protein
MTESVNALLFLAIVDMLKPCLFLITILYEIVHLETSPGEQDAAIEVRYSLRISFRMAKKREEWQKTGNLFLKTLLRQNCVYAG